MRVHIQKQWQLFYSFADEIGQKGKSCLQVTKPTDNERKEYYRESTSGYHTHRVKQSQIHGNPVADGWAGAVMRKPLAI